MIPPPVSTSEELERDRLLAIEAFRTERMQEPLEQYLAAFDEFQGVVEELLETTIDLTQLDDTALDVLCDRRLALAFRYLAGPMISASQPDGCTVERPHPLLGAQAGGLDGLAAVHLLNALTVCSNAPVPPSVWEARITA